MGGKRLPFQVSDGHPMDSQLPVCQCSPCEGRNPYLVGCITEAVEYVQEVSFHNLWYIEVYVAGKV